MEVIVGLLIAVLGALWLGRANGRSEGRSDKGTPSVIRAVGLRFPIHTQPYQSNKG